MSARRLYNFAFFDEGSKREVRRAILKAVAIPGYQVPFASREMPIARGWGTGGLQITLSLVGADDVLKVIDQGADESVNAVSIKRLVQSTTGIGTTEDASEATIIQSRHRIPEVPLTRGQILVLQVPMPEPLRFVEPSEYATKRLHAEKEYSGAYLALFEEIMKYGRVASGADHPVAVNDRYVMAPSPIPRFDNPKLDRSEALILLGAGREKKIYAVPPFTKVASLDFEDHPFEVESVAGRTCRKCGAEGVFMDEIVDEAGRVEYQCNDTSYCGSAASIGHGSASPGRDKTDPGRDKTGPGRDSMDPGHDSMDPSHDSTSPGRSSTSLGRGSTSFRDGSPSLFGGSSSLFGGSPSFRSGAPSIGSRFPSGDGK